MRWAHKMIEETQKTKGKKSTEHRFFISNLPPDAKQIASAVRAHWLIENGLHWTLDIEYCGYGTMKSLIIYRALWMVF